MSYIDFTKQTLKEWVSEIDVDINRYREKKFDEIFDHRWFKNNETVNKIGHHILSHIKEHNTHPTKRLRASLLYHTYRLLRPDMDDKIYQFIKDISISVELVHTWLLIHDDFQDQDDLRRGVVTTHKYYEQYAKDHKLALDFGHFGAGMCINAGDLALTLWYKQVLEAKFDPALQISVLGVLFDGIIQTAFGQSLDLMLEGIGQVNQDIIYWVQNSKTSIYTYQTPILMWAILAQTDETIKKILSDYATDCGIAFQIQDDMIGLFGDPSVTGKSDYNDIIKGKKTLLYLKTLELAKDEDKQFFLDHYGKAWLTIEQAERIKSIIKDCGAYDANLKLAKLYADKALENIKKIPQADISYDEKVYDYFVGIAEYMWVERDK